MVQAEKASAGHVTRPTVPTLEDVVEEFSARLERGEAMEVDAFIRQHGEYAEPLARILPTMQILANLSASNDVTGLAPGAKDRPDLDGTLGDFRILREIGRGGMGIVYEAEQISLSRHVALKVLPFAAVLDERQTARFKNEAMAAALLKHPNIVTVHSVGCERGVHYYAMELVNGQSLAEAIDEMRQRTLLPSQRGAGGGAPAASSGDHPAPAADTLRAGLLSTIQSTAAPAFHRMVAELGIQAAEALDYAHQSGIVHRDIKPANLIVDTRGKLSITDFGLARIGDAMANLTMTGEVLGTLRYMSPEQALGNQTGVDHRTDIYSLGATLYEILALQPAFDGHDRRELFNRIAGEEPRPLRKLNPAIPSDLETIVSKAMAKDAADRYATAALLAADVRRFLEHKPIAARRPSLLKRAGKWSRRHRAIVTTACAVAACALLIGAGLLWRERSQTVAALLTAETQRQLAEANFQRAEDAVDQMLLRVADEKLARIAGLAPVRKQLADDALRFYEKLLEQKGDDRELRFKVAQAWERVGSVRMRLGDVTNALAAYEQAVRIVDALLREYPDDTKYLGLLCACCRHIGKFQGRNDAGREKQREDAINRGLTACRHAQQVSPDERGPRLFATRFQKQLAVLYTELGRTPEAIDLLRDVLPMQRECVAAQPQSPYRMELIASLRLLAQLIAGRNFDEADQLLAEAQALSEPPWPAIRPASEEDGDTPELDLVQVLCIRAGIRNGRGRVAEQESMLRRAINLVDELLAERPEATLLRDTYAQASFSLSKLLAAAGRTDEAESVYRRMCQVLLKHYAPANLAVAQDLARALEKLSSMLAQQSRGDDEELADMRRQFVTILGKQIELGETPELPLLWARGQRAKLNFDLGRFSDTLADITANVELDDEPVMHFKFWVPPSATGACPDESFRAGMLALADKIVTLDDRFPWAYYYRGELYAAMRNSDAARRDFEAAIVAAAGGERQASINNAVAWMLATAEHAELRDPQRAVELAETNVAAVPNERNWRNTLGVARYRNGDWAGAIEALRKSMELNSGKQESSDTFFLAMAYWQLGDKEDAGKWYAEASEWMAKNDPNNAELTRFRAEAAALLGPGGSNAPAQREPVSNSPPAPAEAVPNSPSSGSGPG